MKTLLIFCVVSSVQYAMSEISLVESGPGTVKPGRTLDVTCTVTGAALTDSTNMHGVHWIRQNAENQLQWLGVHWHNDNKGYGSSVQGRLTLSRDTSKGEVYMKLTGMKTEESARYYCVRHNYSGYFDIWGPGTFVTVSSAEKTAPSVFPLMPCCGSSSLSSEVTIGCLSTGYFPTPVDVTWNSGSITSGIRNFPAVLGGNGKYSSLSALRILSSDLESKKYTCNVDHKATGVKINKDITLECTSPTSAPTVEVMQSSCGESGTVNLVCLVGEYSPKDINIEWLLNGEPTSISPSNSTPCKDSDGNFGFKSSISVPKDDWSGGDVYTCKVTHPASSTTHVKNIQKCIDSSAQPKVTLLPPSPKDLLVTNSPTLSCVVSCLTYKDSLNFKWSHSGEETMEDVEGKTECGTHTVRSTLRININDWNSGKTFSCTVQHDDLISPVVKTIKKTYERTTEPTIYILPPTNEEIRSNNQVYVTCRLEGHSSKEMSVIWKINGVNVDEKDYIITDPIRSKDNQSYTTLSRLSTEKSMWTRGSTFTCIGVLSRINSKEIRGNRGK